MMTNSPMARIVVLDIETIPNPYMRCFVSPPKPVDITEHPRNMKKPETIAKWAKAEWPKREAAYQERLERMSLDLDYAMIDSIAWRLMTYDGTTVECVLLSYGDIIEERKALQSFWNTLRDSMSPRLCGYNILNFDWPILLRRSWILGVQPIIYKARRYSHIFTAIIDLMQEFYNWGQGPLQKSRKYRSLKKVCEMYGIENPLPDLDGSMYAEMDTETKAAYNMNDVRMTWELAKRMHGVYWT